MSGKLDDLNVTREELDKISEAFKNKEFRKLFADYCEDIASPESRKLYEEEITQLEKERGVDVTFINPVHGYVIKTSIDGNKLAFINICSNENVPKPSSTKVFKEGSCGRDWRLPHFVSPPREDLNKKGKRCTVYDVIFHPDSLRLAYRHEEFKKFVNNVACGAVESNHNVNVDKTNLKFPKMKYKGFARPLVIRNKTKDFKEFDSDDPVDGVYSQIYKKIDETANFDRKPKETVLKTETAKYEQPKYLIKHRSHIEMENYTNHSTSKINAAIPKELVVEIDLPLLKSAANLTLDVTKKLIGIKSEKPAKYKLNLNLPYEIDEDSGHAKFDQDKKKLIITLPVEKKYTDVVPSNKTIETIDDEKENVQAHIQVLESEYYKRNETVTGPPEPEPFLDPDLHYTLPDYTCQPSNNTLIFTLDVKNVDPTSLDKIYNDNFSSLHMKFTSLSPAYVPTNYAFYLYLPTFMIETNKVYVTIWDNSIVVEIKYFPEQQTVDAYWIGVSEESIREKTVQMDVDDTREVDEDDEFDDIDNVDN